MTREQAIEIGYKRMRACDVYSDYSDRQIRDAAICSTDVAVELGMLTLDEPKALDERINLAINKEIFAYRSVLNAGHIKNALHDAGLKIVEK